MGITSIQQNQVTVVSIVGDLDATTSPEVTAYLDAEIDAGHSNLILDMGGVPYLSSAGLRVILGAMQKARSNGGDLRLAGAQGNIRRVLDMSGIAQVIKAFPTAEEAAASYGA